MNQSTAKGEHIKKTQVEDINILNYAPGEGGKIINADIAKYAEEQCFPHLFPQGIFYLCQNYMKIHLYFQGLGVTSVLTSLRKWDL